MMIVADDAGNSPGTVFVLPEMNELAFTNRFGVVMAGVVKAVIAHLHRTIALHVINLQCPGNEFAGHFAANILLDALRQVLPAKSYATLVVVELHVFHKKTA